MQPDQWEGSIGMIERDTLPGCRCVAGSASGPKLTVVMVLCRVTRVTILGCAFINIVDVAGFAGNIGMRPSQREGCVAVIERCILPFGGVMTR